MIIGTAQESKGYALIALIICGCIIPARGVIRGFYILEMAWEWNLPGLEPLWGQQA